MQDQLPRLLPDLKPGTSLSVLAQNVVRLIKVGFSRGEAKEIACDVAGVRLVKPPGSPSADNLDTEATGEPDRSVRSDRARTVTSDQLQRLAVKLGTDVATQRARAVKEGYTVVKEQPERPPIAQARTPESPWSRSLETKSMVCRRCNNRIRPNSRFCEWCGSPKLAEPSDDTSPPQSEESGAAESSGAMRAPTDQRWSSVRTVVMKLAGAVLLVTNFIFPPWVSTFQFQGISQMTVPAGYALVFMPPKAESIRHGVTIDLRRLTLQTLAISVLFAFGLGVVRQRKVLRDVHTPHDGVSNASGARTTPKPSPTPQTSNTESSLPRPPENARGQQAQADRPSRPIPDAGQIIRRVSVGLIVALAVLVVIGVTSAPSLWVVWDPAPPKLAPKGPAPKWLGAEDLASPVPLVASAQVASPAPTPRTLATAKTKPLPRYDFEGIAYSQTVPGVERPETGAELFVALKTGLGSLSVRNGTSPDAVVILFQGDVQRRSIYIRASDAAVIPKVAAGTYNVRFTSGRWWNGDEFLKEASFSEFERQVVFAETQEADGIAYSDVNLTLNRVIGGNARTRPTPPFKLSKQLPLEGR